MLKPQPSTKFKRDLKLVIKQGNKFNETKTVINLLLKRKKLPSKYKDHKLYGNWCGYRECHISPDLLLIYRTDKLNGTLKLMRLGSHANLFNL